MTKQQQIAHATEVMKKYEGKPYLWGGDDPMSGFDCSGIVLEALKSCGRLPSHKSYDTTAHGLYMRFKEEGLAKDMTEDSIFEGCLVFWGSEERINHVEYCLDDEISIGASGGGSRTKSEADAIAQNAYIKRRPWRYRSPYAVIDPFNIINGSHIWVS